MHNLELQMRLNILKRVNAYSILAISFLFLSSTNFASAQQDAAASISNLSGYVTATSADGEVRRLVDGDKLMEGDVLNTGNESSVLITLNSGEIIKLGELANYTIDAVQDAKKDTDVFAQRSLINKSPTLSTATSAGGGISAPTTPTPGGSPTN